MAAMSAARPPAPLGSLALKVMTQGRPWTSPLDRGSDGSSEEWIIDK